MLSFVLMALARASDLDQRFTKYPATLGSRSIEVYFADTPDRRARGLMFVESLPKDTGMLFAFPSAQPLTFWMKNTLIPLAIGFFDDQCVLREVVEMKVASSVLGPPPTYSSTKPMRFALEMNAKWFEPATRAGARLKFDPKAKPPEALSACR